jgi:signal transduction histidine kinase
VFLNIIINAAHAIGQVTDEGNAGKGRITIRTRRHEDCAQIRIEDTGAGIPEDVQSRIFEPFFTTKDVGRGTGQGLAIAHSVVVQKHGGRIWFETGMGTGTTFVIQLPLSDVSSSEEDDPESAFTKSIAMT